MTENYEDELKKGCGKELACGKCGEIIYYNSLLLCDECKARLEEHQNHSPQRPWNKLTAETDKAAEATEPEDSPKKRCSTSGSQNYEEEVVGNQNIQNPTTKNYEDFCLKDKIEGLRLILKEIGLSNVQIEVVINHVIQTDKELIKRLKEELGENLLTGSIGKYGYPKNVVRIIDKLTGDLK